MMRVVVGDLDFAAPGLLMTALLEDTAGVPHPSQMVCVGDIINVDEDDGFLRGHGTYVSDGKLVATVCGVVERVNKLVSVRPLKSRYNAELGDVVIGRVREIGNRRWMMDIGAQAQASLQLSAVNLPGGIQRRRTADDELNMRHIFREGDLISCEVQQINQSDKSINLHTRSSKYRRLKLGQLVQVPPRLIKRQSSHFIDLEDLGVQMIIGCNGWVWLGLADKSKPKKPEFAQFQNRQEEEEEAPFEPDEEQMKACARLSNAIKGLAKVLLPIYKESLLAAMNKSIEANIPPSAMLGMDFLAMIIELEEERRRSQMDTS